MKRHLIGFGVILSVLAWSMWLYTADAAPKAQRDALQYDYETVAASQSDQVLGSTGKAGDILHSLVCVVSTAATAATSIKDGAGSAIAVLPNSPGQGIGTYTIELHAMSTSGAWKVTTGAGVACIGVGWFT
ncbi:MAG: hypothetical protein KGP14_12555 [Betaproteobacteria bacterium]|nr:hypothetical protein [Betaproteobacteria bacterium]